MEKKKTVAGLTAIGMILIAMGMIATVSIFSGCIGKETEEDIIRQMVRQTPVVIGEEKIGGEYNASILTVRKEYKGMNQTWQQIEYTKDGKTIKGDLPPGIRDSLDWIKQNTPKDATIMNWWDYGDSIIGYTGRNSVIRFVSKEMLDTVAMYKYLEPEEQKKWEVAATPHGKIKDVATVLTTKNPREAIEIMEKYNASYLFIYRRDASISHIFFSALGETPIKPDTEEFRMTIIGKASKSQEIDGFKLVYSDENVKLYKAITLLPSSVGAETQTFIDSFDNGDNWYLGDGWSIVEDKGNFILKGEKHSFAKAAIPGTVESLELKIKIDKGGVHLNVRVGKRGELVRYFIGLSEGQSYIQKQLGLNEFETLMESRKGIPLNQWHKIKISLKDNNINVFTNDTLLISARDKNPLSEGGISFEPLENSFVYFDDVKAEIRLSE